MSKNTPKQNVEQLQSWLSWILFQKRKPTNKKK